MSNLDETLNAFISRTSKSKVAVIVPLFGYWEGVQNNPLGIDTLRVTLDRLQSSTHNLYVFFVGETLRTPLPIAQEIVVRSQAGNVQGIEARKGSSYADYVREGLAAALDSTDAAYFVVLNPWVLIQKIGIDVLIDRVNYGDDAKLISGYDLRSMIDAESESFAVAFDNFFLQTPKEERAVNSNFMGISRYALEMLQLDENIKTQKFMEYDIWQQFHTMRFEAVSSQRIPMFVFDVEIDSYENDEDYDADKAYFQSKWGFLPELPINKPKRDIVDMSNVNDDGTTNENESNYQTPQTAPSAPREDGMLEHTITQEDLDRNDAWVAAGLKVGDTIEYPEPMSRDEAIAAGIDVEAIEEEFKPIPTENGKFQTDPVGEVKIATMADDSEELNAPPYGEKVCNVCGCKMSGPGVNQFTECAEADRHPKKEPELPPSLGDNTPEPTDDKKTVNKKK